MLEVPQGRVDRQAVTRRHGDRVALGQERAVVADDASHRAEPDDPRPPADGIRDGLLHELERLVGVRQDRPRIHRDLVEAPLRPGAGRRDQPDQGVSNARTPGPHVWYRLGTGPEGGMGLGAELEQVGPAPGPSQPAIPVQRHQILGLLRERVDQEGEPHPRPVRGIRRSFAVLTRRFVQALWGLIKLHEIRINDVVLVHLAQDSGIHRARHLSCLGVLRKGTV